MLLSEFPDIDMVRRLKANAISGQQEWRNVVLNFECREASRLNLSSPYSFFINRKGASYCAVNNNQYKIETDTILFSQPGDTYGLTIDNIDKTEICNIHISKRFFENAMYALTTSSAHLLHQPESEHEPTIQLFTQLYQKDQQTKLLVDRLTHKDTYSNNQFDECLTELIGHQLLQNNEIRKRIAALPFVKSAVRKDIYSRLALARDIMRSNYDKVLDLDAICRETGMSKFHFLRVFKCCFGITPYQFLTDVRMQKAIDLLQFTRISVSEIDSQLGFDYPNSFIKAFTYKYKIAPMQYRRLQNSNFG
jgi:AraC family transcriptional regulator